VAPALEESEIDTLPILHVVRRVESDSELEGFF
jgi:hypothetical protein